MAAVLVDLLLGDDVGLIDRLRSRRESALLPERAQGQGPRTGE